MSLYYYSVSGFDASRGWFVEWRSNDQDKPRAGRKYYKEEAEARRVVMSDCTPPPGLQWLNQKRLPI